MAHALSTRTKSQEQKTRRVLRVPEEVGAGAWVEQLLYHTLRGCPALKGAQVFHTFTKWLFTRLLRGNRRIFADGPDLFMFKLRF